MATCMAGGSISLDHLCEETHNVKIGCLNFSRTRKGYKIQTEDRLKDTKIRL